MQTSRRQFIAYSATAVSLTLFSIGKYFLGRHNDNHNGSEQPSSNPSSIPYTDYTQFEDTIYSLLEKSILQDRSSVSDIFSYKDKVIYSSNDIAKFAGLNPFVNLPSEVLDLGSKLEGDNNFYVEVGPVEGYSGGSIQKVLSWLKSSKNSRKSTKNKTDNMYCRYVHFNHEGVDQKGNLMFEYKKEKGKVEVSLGLEKDVRIVYKKDASAITKTVFNPINAIISNTVVDQSQLDKYVTFANQIHMNYRPSFPFPEGTEVTTHTDVINVGTPKR